MHLPPRINAGVQSNYRAEDEGGGEPVYKCTWPPFEYALKWNKPITEKWLFILANNSSQVYQFKKAEVYPMR